MAAILSRPRCVNTGVRKCVASRHWPLMLCSRSKDSVIVIYILFWKIICNDMHGNASMWMGEEVRLLNMPSYQYRDNNVKSV